MRKRFLFFAVFLPFSFLVFSCSSQKEMTYAPESSFVKSESPLERKVSGRSSRELPVSPHVNPESLDSCTRYLLFTNQYISVSDYPEAEESLRIASKFCSPEDPRFNYMRALLLDIKGKKEEAYKYYYKAAKEYINMKNMEGAFEAYSGMVSIAPERKETKEIGSYFLDEDY